MHNLAPLLELTKTSDSVIGGSIGQVLTKKEPLHVPRFIFLGPKGAAFQTLHPEFGDSRVLTCLI